MPHLLIFEEQKVGSNRTRLFHKLGSSSAWLVATDACQTETHPWFYLRQCQQSTDEFPAPVTGNTCTQQEWFTLTHSNSTKKLISCPKSVWWWYSATLAQLCYFQVLLEDVFFSFANAFKIDYGLKNFLNSPVAQNLIYWVLSTRWYHNHCRW